VRQKGPNISQEDTTARLWYIYRAVVPNDKPIKNLLLILALKKIDQHVAKIQANVYLHLFHSQWPVACFFGANFYKMPKKPTDFVKAVIFINQVTS